MTVMCLFLNLTSSKIYMGRGKRFSSFSNSSTWRRVCSIARKGLTTDRWIDRAENEGKRSGAFPGEPMILDHICFRPGIIR